MISCHRIDILGLFSYQVASLRSFGMTVFYFMMGIYIHIDADFFKARFGWSVLVTLINVLVSPIFVWLMAYLCRLKTRTTIITGMLCNSLGETTLTLQVVAYEAGIFSRDTFQVLSVDKESWRQRQRVARRLNL